MATEQDFFNSVSNLMPALKEVGVDRKRFSDIEDDDGHQYIDLVMEGGGTLGIALLGYIYMLEQAGLRFLGIGGTSAGAVSAIALAAAGRPEESRLRKLIAVLANMPMKSFVDGKDKGDSDAVEVVNSWLEGKGALTKIWTMAQIIDNFREIDGLNRGETFLSWMSSTLKDLNGGRVMTVRALRERMTDVQKELWVGGESRNDPSVPINLYQQIDDRRRYLLDRNCDYLAVVSADISTETRLELPRMAGLIWEKPDDLDVALLARASMSIPVFFAPLRIKSQVPDDKVRDLWRQLQRPDESYSGDFLPAKHCLVDGGVLSNFPIRAFHSKGRMPLRPTFGVKLQYDTYRIDIGNVFDIVRHSFNSARHALDLEFIEENPDYKRLVANIDTGDIQWLDFDMIDKDKIDLFRRGAETALRFLEKFDWNDYRRVRRLLLQSEGVSV